jgi:cytochrome c biogenesis protein CcmG/thiol:disulfide interchange protein DsbE
MRKSFLRLACSQLGTLIHSTALKRRSLFFAILMSFITFNAFAETPEMAPDFTLPDIHTGEMVKLSDYRGKLVLVDFWASWCGPCRASFPAYSKMRKELHAKLGEDAFEILAINVDVTAKDGRAFLESTPVEFPVLREDSGATQQNYQLIAMPTSFLIDPNGKILIAHQGFSQGYITQYYCAYFGVIRTPISA